MQEQACWQAVSDRNKEYDGVFVYAVRSTGIYCRPSCPSRRPRREQVQFFDRPAAAEQAGFRACRRCHPQKATVEDPNLGLVEQMCRYLVEKEDRAPTLEELSQQFHMSPYHLQRTFKRIVGVTPRQYAAAQRADRLKAQLKERKTVTEAIYEAGYQSSSSALRPVGWPTRHDTRRLSARRPGHGRYLHNHALSAGLSAGGGDA